MKYFLTTLPFLLIFACAVKRPISQFQTITADVETVPATSKTGDDAADDPAIWVHPTDASKSIIIGTVKNFGLEVYNLQGQRLHSYPIGRPNNVDVRYGFPLENGNKVAIVACSERGSNEILIFSIQPEDASLKLISAHRLKSTLDEVYGFCLYRSNVSNQYYAFVNGKNGILEQWLLTPFGNAEITGKVVRTLKIASQPEGMVADDQLGVVYVGEEDKGIWRFLAEPEQPASLELLAQSGQENPNITYDVEGLALYHASDSTGYLIASSQGNNSYAVFERQGKNRYLGNFSIGNGSIDSTSETDGLEVTGQNLGAPFRSGLFIVQDGDNTDESGTSIPQNFKLVAWEKVEKIIKSFKK